MVDVLIVENSGTEAVNTAKWLGLAPREYAVFKPQDHLRGSTAAQLKNVETALDDTLKNENPKVIVFDVMFDESGLMDFNGETLCVDCADCYPGVGRVFVSAFPAGLAPQPAPGRYQENLSWRKPWTSHHEVPQPGTEAMALRQLINASVRANDCRARRLTDPAPRPTAGH